MLPTLLRPAAALGGAGADIRRPHYCYRQYPRQLRLARDFQNFARVWATPARFRRARPLRAGIFPSRPAPLSEIPTGRLDG
jgi:hypothetical protein